MTPLFPLDDVVMGGVSESTFDNEARRWSGTVSALNSGGFVGIRSKTLSPPRDVSATNGVELRVRGGGGMRFKMVLRDSTDFNGVAYSASFDTNRALPFVGLQPQTVRIPFEQLVPTIFARTVPDKSFDPQRLVAIQFALSKFEYDGALNPRFKEGDFELEILDVGFF